MMKETPTHPLLQLLLAVLLCYSCAGSDKKNTDAGTEQSVSDTAVETIAGARADTAAPLIVIPAAWSSQFPDTNRSFPDLKSLFTYISPMKQAFLRTKTSNDKVLEFDDSDTSLAVKRAFDKTVSALVLKHARKWNDNEEGLTLLEIHADISTIEKLALFDRLPQKLRQSSAGKRVHATLIKYTYDRNLQFDFTAFNNLDVEQLNGTRSKFKDLLTDPKKYTLLMFGASWCHPCRIQERELKKRYAQSIDTASMQVIGISIDANSAQFRKYITQEEFPWPSYRIDGGEENAVFKQLGLNGVPRNFLLASDGKILKEDLNVFEVLR